MAKRIDTFEGFTDHEPGWEFDCPTYMIKPAVKYTESNQLQDTVIEDYMIDYSLDGNPPEDEELVERRSILLQFAFAKKGKAREGIVYWRRVVEWDPEQEDIPCEVLEDISYDRNTYEKVGESSETIKNDQRA